MPGNEVGDRIHNFFGHENLSPSQDLSQVVEGTWPGLGNNFWAVSQRQIATPFLSNLKNNIVPQPADPDGGHSSSSMQHGANISQSTVRPEFATGQFHIKQPSMNGCTHDHQMFQTKQNEANMFGMDSESNVRNFTSRGFSVLDLQSQLGNGSESHKKNVELTDYTESPVSYDFLGGRQEMITQHPAMFQSFPRQQLGINDMQILQQQVLLKQIQEFQRHQQFQNQQVMQMSSSVQAAGNHPTSSLVNRIPVRNASNCSWQQEHVSANSWFHHSVSPAMQGPSTALMFSPERGEVPCSVSMVSQQFDRSPYGSHISGAKVSPNSVAPMQIDKSTVQQISGSGSSFSGNEFARHPDQVGSQDGVFTPRMGQQEKDMIVTPDGLGLNSGFGMQHLKLSSSLHKIDADTMQEFGARRDLASPSELSQDKVVVQVPPLKVATLDPTEKKILFGSDDNLWDTFGKGSGIGLGGNNMLDGTEFSGTFPSMQSGSWSALMQSAVAESSGGNIGTQEEWSGPTFLTGDLVSKDQHNQTLNDVGKQQFSWTNNSSQASNLNSGFFPPGNNNSNKTCSSVANAHQSRVDVSYDHVEGIQVSSSQRSIELFPGEGTQWLQTEVSQDFGQVSHSSDAELNPRLLSGSWTGQHSIPLNNVSSSERYSKSNGMNFMNPHSPTAFGALKNELNSNALHFFRSSEQRNPMSGFMGHDGGIWKMGSVSSPVVALGLVKPVTASPQVNGESSDLNNIAAAADLVRTGASPESSQHIDGSGDIDVWKNVRSSVTAKWSEIPGKGHLDMGINNHQFELPRNNSLANGTVEMHDKQNSRVIENRYNTIGVGENDTIDSCGFSGGKQKLSGQSGQKPFGRKFHYHPMGDVDVDTRPSNGTKHVTRTQSIGQQQASQELRNYEQGFMNQLKVHSHTVGNSMEIDQAHSSSLHGETSISDEAFAKSTLTGSGLSTYTSLDLAVHRPALNRTAMSSQNMLQLFHKKEQSRDAGNSTQLSSSDGYQSSGIPELRASNVPFHLQQNQAPARQGFGLQLGLSSERLSTDEQAFSSQRLSQAINRPREVSIPSAAGEKGHTLLVPASAAHSLPLSCDVSGPSGQAGINCQGNVLANLFPGFSHSKSHLKIQHGANIGGHMTVSHDVNMSFDRFSLDSKHARLFERVQTNQSSSTSVSELSRGMLHEVVACSTELFHPSNHFRDQKFPVLEAAPVPHHDDIPAMECVGVASKGFPVSWPNVPAQQRTLDGQPISTSPDMLVSDINSSKISEPLSFNQHCQDQNMQTETGVRSETDACLATQLYLVGKEQPGQGDNLAQINPGNDPSLRMMNASQGKETAANHLPGTNVSSTVINQGGTAAVGNSLQTNNPFHQDSSSVCQVQGTENPEIDPYSHTLKKFKGAGATVDAQSFLPQREQKISTHDNMVQDGSVDEKSIPAGESKMQNFSGKLIDGHDRNGPSDSIVAVCQSEGQKFVGSDNSAFMITEHYQISPQMAPWFDRYGTFKNGQIVPTYDSQKMAKSKTTELPFTFGRSFERLHAQNVMGQGNAVTSNADHCTVVLNSSISMPISCENFSSSQSLHPDTASPGFSVQRPRKRKSATSELVSWQKEVAYGCQRINNFSVAEVGWAIAANCLAEKAEDEADMVEDVSLVLRLKRRLILTTHLMQLLLFPPSASILFANAFSNYDSVTHLVSRSTLGDTCSTLCCSEINTSAPSNVGNHQQSQSRTQKISDQFFLKVMDNLISRARKLGNELSRLDKRVSVLDLRVELQDLEKFAVINRFAKFHGRGQADVVDTLSSSDASTNAQRYFLQRYVTAVQMPRNLPDRVQCLSL